MRTVTSYFNVMARLTYIHFANRFAKYNIGAGEHRIIDFVCRHPGSNQDDVACYFNMNKGATSRMVKSLAKKGFITAEISPDDKRHKLLYPTVSGKDIFPLLDSSRWEWEAEFLKGVTVERDELMKILTTIESNMKNAIEREKAE